MKKEKKKLFSFSLKLRMETDLCCNVTFRLLCSTSYEIYSIVTSFGEASSIRAILSHVAYMGSATIEEDNHSQPKLPYLLSDF